MLAMEIQSVVSEYNVVVVLKIHDVYMMLCREKNRLYRSCRDILYVLGVQESVTQRLGFHTLLSSLYLCVFVFSLYA